MSRVIVSFVLFSVEVLFHKMWLHLSQVCVMHMCVFV